MLPPVLVVGAGIFGVAAAKTLRARGHHVTLLDPALRRDPDGRMSVAGLPPLAESTDISKVVRLDYGTDRTYLRLMERAMIRWRAWQAGWTAAGLGPLFSETGVMFLSREPLRPGLFEQDCLDALTANGHSAEILDPAAIRRRFPAWNAERYPGGYFNPQGGFAQSGRVVAALLAEAEAAGVEIRDGVGAIEILTGDRGVTGVRTSTGETLRADRVVVAAGTWTQTLMPWLADDLCSVGQPVFHLRPADPTLYSSRHFPVFGADISRTGWYGFPANRDGVVKIANHGAGRRMDPNAADRVVSEADEQRLHAFLAETFPGLVDAPIVHRRLCVYGDSRDLHFWIAADPERAGLVVAAGGSGHGFKFAPVLGDLVADAVEGNENPELQRFRWRPDRRLAAGEEEARAE